MSSNLPMSNELIQILLSLYGLSDSRDYWLETLTRHHLTR